MTIEYSHTACIPFPRRDVVKYYESAGGAARLCPDFSTTLTSGPSKGLAEGSETELEIGLPWLDGLAPVSTTVKWKARHTAYTPGESFTDTMVQGPLDSWEHTHTFSDDTFSDSGGGSSLVQDQVTAELPGKTSVLGKNWLVKRKIDKELERTFEFRTRQIVVDLTFQQQLRDAAEKGGTANKDGAIDPTTAQTFVIAGETGLVGQAISTLLRSLGHNIVALTRSSRTSRVPGVTYKRWDPSKGSLDPSLLKGASAVINLAGTSIMGRFTDDHKKSILDSRIDATTTLVDAMKEAASDGGPTTLINASASGYYGADAGTVTEDSPAGDDFLADVCQRWESTALKAEEAGIRVVLVRTGLVLSARGGLLGTQLPLYLMSGGGPLNGGEMWQPWIGIDDLAQIYIWSAFNPEVSGPINAAAPYTVKQKEFASTLAKVLHRPSVIPTPRVGPDVLMGKEGADQLALSSVKMEPEALEKNGYAFRFTDLEEALRHTLGK